MSKQVSPFAALTGAEKQIRWLEYQSIRLPYIEGSLDHDDRLTKENKGSAKATVSPEQTARPEIPQPPPEVPRTLPVDCGKTRHGQYDAVIARLKQAELQSRRYASQTAEKSH